MKRQKWTVLAACLMAMVFLTLPGVVMAEKGATAEKVKVAVSEATGPVVNINTADVEELATLTGVGKEIAQRIVEYRQANGPFKSVEQLKNIKGIGEKILEKNMNRLTVGEPAK